MLEGLKLLFLWWFVRLKEGIPFPFDQHLNTVKSVRAFQWTVILALSNDIPQIFCLFVWLWCTPYPNAHSQISTKLCVCVSWVYQSLYAGLSICLPYVRKSLMHALFTSFLFFLIFLVFRLICGTFFLYLPLSLYQSISGVDNCCWLLLYSNSVQKKLKLIFLPDKKKVLDITSTTLTWLGDVH